MTAADPYAPIEAGEVEKAKATLKKAKVDDRVPIVPVPADAPDMTFKHPVYGAPTKVWAYRDATGQLLGYDGRFEYVEAGKPAKEVLPITFCQLTDGKRAWRSKAFPTKRPIYGQDRLAARPDAPVIVTEGCKAADAVEQLLPDHVGVSWPGGSNAAHVADWSPLEGRDVIIWPDRDRQRHKETNEELPYEEQPGPRCAKGIARLILGVAAKVRILDLRDHECESGWDAADALADGWSGDDVNGLIGRFGVAQERPVAELIMPMGFELSDAGLFYNDDGDMQRLSGPIDVLAQTRAVNSSNWGLLLEWKDDDGRSHRWAMPKSLTSGDGNSIREVLLDGGLMLAPGQKARQRFAEFLAMVRTPARARAVSQVGWCGNAFALPDMTYGDTAGERIIFQVHDAYEHNYTSSGTLTQWQNSVAKLAIGNSRLVLALSAAFVGPLLALVEAEGGGINYKGRSSIGKTTGLTMAGSVWGPPAFMRQWRATANGLEGVSVQHSETLLLLDELGQLDPREAGSVAYMLANGQGKVRAGQKGNARPSARYRLQFLSSGEIGLADLVGRDGRSKAPLAAGQEVRIIDLEADAGHGLGIFENIHDAISPEALALRIKHAVGQHYGTAAPAFLSQLTAAREFIPDSLRQAINLFVKNNVPPSSDGQVGRVAYRFGLIAAAGELAQAFGVLPWAAGEATAGAEACFRSWLGSRGGSGSVEARNAISIVRRFIEAHGDSRFDDKDNPTERAVINRAGFRSSSDMGTEYLILREIWSSEVCQGMDPKIVSAVLASRGMLRTDSAGKTSVPVTLPKLGKTRVYAVTPKLFEAADA